MTADEFLAWSAKQPREAGRFELVDGHVIEMMAERLVHVEVKFALALALRNAAKASGKPCFTLTDGAKVRVSKAQTYDPDGLLYCGQRHPPDLIEIPNPIIVIEVLSPDSVDRDHGEKVQAYFSVASVMHYLIADPDRQVIIHHRRGNGEDIITRFHRSGRLELEPPGIVFDVAEVFERRD